MPRLVAKIEGRGNGIKTVVVNMAEIATSLNRPAVSGGGMAAGASELLPLETASVDVCTSSPFLRFCPVAVPADQVLRLRAGRADALGG
jgi:hypothetical protein